jgi:carbamoyltransferase
MHILGISALTGDSAAVILRDGRVVAAAKEEWFTRTLHETRFPEQAAAYCLETAGIGVDDLQFVASHEAPVLKVRMRNGSDGRSPAAFGKGPALSQGRAVRGTIRKYLGYRGDILFVPYHQSLGATFFLSPFDEAAVLVIAASSEGPGASYGWGRANQIALTNQLATAGSLDGFAIAVAGFVGCTGADGLAALMKMAAAGKPAFRRRILRDAIDLKLDGSYAMAPEYALLPDGTASHGALSSLFGECPGWSRESALRWKRDIARSLQCVVEDAVLRSARRVRREIGTRRLVVAGNGVLLGSVYARLWKETPFDDVWMLAAPEQSAALGAALFVSCQLLGTGRANAAEAGRGLHVGPGFSDAAVASYLDEARIPYERLSEGEVPGKVAHLLASGKTVGWFQGKMAFLSENLGGRAILGHPQSRAVQDGVIPGTPGTVACDTVPRRIATAELDPDAPCRIHDVAAAFQEETGSTELAAFPLRYGNEPIACTPREAYACFMRTRVEYLVMGPFLLDKKEQPLVEETGDWVDVDPSAASEDTPMECRTPKRYNIAKAIKVVLLILATTALLAAAAWRLGAPLPVVIGAGIGLPMLWAVANAVRKAMQRRPSKRLKQGRNKSYWVEAKKQSSQLADYRQ